MKFVKQSVLALAMLGAGLPALAHNASLALIDDGAGKWHAYFDSATINWHNANLPLDNDPDVITFTGLAAGSYKVSLVGMELGDSDDPISFSSITLNGANVSILDTTFKLKNYVASSVPLVLSLSGRLNEPEAHYFGALNVVAVPEPETYAMFLAGLGILAGAARRRKSA